MEAEKTVAAKTGPKHKHHYTPPAHIGQEEGVRKRSDASQDSYFGTKEQLVSLGLVPDGLFPGDPGMPISTVTLWPTGTARRAPWRTPGRMRIVRAPSGKFCASLAVSDEERERRYEQCERDAAVAKAKWDAEERFRKAVSAAGTSLDDIVKTLGFSAVVDHVYRLRRNIEPPRPAGHLRVVWSAT